MRPLRIGIVAGESSGDVLGATLIRAIRRIVPDTVFEGVAGPEMTRAACRALYPVERLSVMGLSEVLGHLPRLMRVRRALKRHFYSSPPDIFVGVDAPDFNLGLERALKNKGTPTVHVVSPSIWAWRRYRIRHICKSTDLMLTLFPFEETYYQQENIPVACMGHPLADEIPRYVDRKKARRRLALAENRSVVAVLPGSRIGEVQQLAGPFLETMEWCRERRPGLQFVVPFASKEVGSRFLSDMGNRKRADVTFLHGQSHEALAAADAVLLASGTAALETLLFRRPMVVAYRVSGLTWQVLRHLVRLPYYSLPNLLAGRKLVPEYIQDEIKVDQMGQALLSALDKAPDDETLTAFDIIHESLRQGADQVPAQRIIALANR